MRYRLIKLRYRLSRKVSVMPTIGNVDDAQFILDWCKENGTGRFNKLPDGWARLGSGISRTVYLSPDGVAYKVGDAYANEADHMLSEVFRRKPIPKGWDIPVAHYFEELTVNDTELTVLAMEYVKGFHRPPCDDVYYKGCQHTDCVDVDRQIAHKAFSLSDFHEGNYVIRDSDGAKVIIDFGEGLR